MKSGRSPIPQRSFERPNLKKILALLKGYIKLEKKRFLGLAALTLVLTGLGLATPAVIAEAIDWIPQIPAEKSLNDLLLLLAAALGLYLVQTLLSYGEELLSSRFFLEIASRMRRDYFKKVSGATVGYLDTCRHGDLLSRGTNDIETVVKLLSETVMKLVSGVVLFIGCLIIMLSVSWQLTCICLCTTVLTLIASAVLAHFIRKHSARQQKLLGSLNSFLEDCLPILKSIKLFNREKHASHSFADLSEKLRKESVLSLRWLSAVAPVNHFIGNLNFLLIAMIGGILAASGSSTVTISAIVLFILYVREYTETLNDFSETVSEVQTAITAADRFFAVLNAPEEDHCQSEEKMQDGSLELKDVHFSYTADREVLSGIDLHVESGQSVAIVGPSGCGKTTLVQLLLRLYEADAGTIRAGGVDIRDLPLDQLRENMIAILQDDVVLEESLAYNLTYGIESDAPELLASISHSLKLDAAAVPVCDHLSRGQIQRVCASRAYFVNPKIVILDESMSLVDPVTYSEMFRRLREKLPDATIITITHQLSCLRDCDRIFCMEDGRITEEGTFDQLVKNNGLFSKMLGMYH